MGAWRVKFVQGNALGVVHSFWFDGYNCFDAQTTNSIIGFYHHKFCLVIDFLYCSRDHMRFFISGLFYDDLTELADHPIQMVRLHLHPQP